jgi:hypothetical protein
VQCLLIFPIILYVFTSAICLVLCGTESALLVYVVVMFFSHNIVASLCCCSVDRFMLAIAILRYDCKLVLNTTIRKLFVVGTYKP